MIKKKDTSKIQVLFQLLAKKKNKELLFVHRERAGLPKYGIAFGNGIDLSKYDLTTVVRHLGVYKAILAHNNPSHFDTFISQDQTVNDFLQEYFIFNQVSDKTIKNINLTGCEFFSLSEAIDLPNKSLFLPKGVYVRIGTNNPVNNIKTFILSNSKIISETQLKLSGNKAIKLKPSQYFLRDNFIFHYHKIKIKDLLLLAKNDGLLPEIQSKLKNFERKETIIQIYVKKVFKQKLSNGSIRKIISKMSK